jgi:hypothetical protein
LFNIEKIAAGYYHSLFLKKNGTVWGCGANSFGQLGIGNFDLSKNTLQQVIGATNIKQISAGAFHSLFLKNDGTVWGCGRNKEGQLGIGNFDVSNNTLQQVKGLDGNGYITDIKEIYCGMFTSLFLKNNGSNFKFDYETFGSARTILPVPGNYRPYYAEDEAIGPMRPALFNANHSSWRATYYSNGHYYTNSVEEFGSPSDLPAPADFDGDGQNIVLSPTGDCL